MGFETDIPLRPPDGDLVNSKELSLIFKLNMNDEEYVTQLHKNIEKNANRPKEECFWITDLYRTRFLRK